MIRFINSGKSVETARIVGTTKSFLGSLRDSLEITVLDSSYDEINSLFVDGAEFEIVDDSGSFNKSEYCVAGPITDNRDGTYVVFMSVKNEHEVMRELLDSLVVDKVITEKQKLQIVENRLPKKEVVTGFTSDEKPITELKNYVEV